jgi:hypothetical protein
MTKYIDYIPADDICTNHSLQNCTCEPVITEKVGSKGESLVETTHRYTDKKGYIKDVCSELGVSTPKFVYNKIMRNLDNIP